MSKALDKIRHVIATANDMTVATLRPDGWPQATTVSYAGDGLKIYFGTGTHAQKAQNIARNNKVSLTINLPYSDWNRIVGISAAGFAAPVTDAKEIAHVGELMVKKFPQIANFVAPDGAGDMAIFRIDLKVASLLDYSKGFGHTDLVKIGAA